MPTDLEENEEKTKDRPHDLGVDFIDRCIILGDLLLQINNDYCYSGSQGGFSWNDRFPPAPGTALNCESASYLFKWLAEKQGVQGLEITRYCENGGFLVVVRKDMYLMGQLPQLTAKCGGKEFGFWDFANHYRVKDPYKQANKAYDPIFGSSGVLNPLGIKCTKPDITQADCTYGKKYQVKKGWKNNKYIQEVVETSPRDVEEEDLIRDTHYKKVDERRTPDYVQRVLDAD